MPSTILLRTISGTADQRIVLSNSHFARPHGVSTWNKLRLAVRWSMRDSGGNLGGTPVFAAGFCSGNASIFGDASVTHFVGVRTNGTSWSRIAGPPIVYDQLAAGAIQSGKMVGTTFTVAQNWLSVVGYATAEAPTGSRCCWFIDITKGSPNFTFGGYGRINTNAGDIDYSTYITQAEIDAATLANHAACNVGTTAVDEGTNGTLDHINLSWNRTTPEIEISDLAVVRLA